MTLSTAMIISLIGCSIVLASCCACVSSMMIPFCRLPVFTPIGAKKVLSIVFTQSGADFIELATASEKPFLAISDSRFDRITF
ncbi:MAG: hypothetical protein IIX22_04425 [Ruminococcus sp.]|nr:hypothetical protein [Ruminococcus sp.]